MRGADLLMAARTVRGDWRVIPMRLVAARAIGRSVHDHSGDVVLLLAMATQAILCRERFNEPAIVGSGGRRRAREGVTAHTLGSRARPIVPLRLTDGVFDARLRCMASRTTSGRHTADRARLQIVAAIAGDVLLSDVHAVPGHAAIRRPLRLHLGAVPARVASALG